MDNRIKEIRKTLGLSQMDLAEKVGTTFQQIQRLETGGRRLSDVWIDKISKALKVEPWMILIDPKNVIGKKDYEIISRYHMLPDHLQAAVDAILFQPDKKT